MPQHHFSNLFSELSAEEADTDLTLHCTVAHTVKLFQS